MPKVRKSEQVTDLVRKAVKSFNHAAFDTSQLSEVMLKQYRLIKSSWQPSWKNLVARKEVINVNKGNYPPLYKQNDDKIETPDGGGCLPS